MRRLLTALAATLQIPALLILESQALIRVVDFAGLEYVLPSGLHTYVPLAETIPLATLVRWAIPASVLGLALLAAQPRWRSRSGWSQALRPSRSHLLKAGAVLAAAQFLGYVLQVAYVNQVQGVPDASVALIAAVGLQSLLVAVLVGATGAVRNLPPLIQPVRVFIPTSTRTVLGYCGWNPLAVPTGDPVACAPRRGPPVDLLLAIQI